MNTWHNDAKIKCELLANAADPAHVRTIYRRFGKGWKAFSHEMKEELVAETTQRIHQLAEHPRTLELLAWLELARVVDLLQMNDKHQRQRERRQRESGG